MMVTSLFTGKVAPFPTNHHKVHIGKQKAKHITPKRCVDQYKIMHGSWSRSFYKRIQNPQKKKNMRPNGQKNYHISHTKSKKCAKNVKFKSGSDDMHRIFRYTVSSLLKGKEGKTGQNRRKCGTTLATTFFVTLSPEIAQKKESESFYDS